MQIKTDVEVYLDIIRVLSKDQEANISNISEVNIK